MCSGGQTILLGKSKKITKNVSCHSTKISAGLLNRWHYVSGEGPTVNSMNLDLIVNVEALNAFKRVLSHL